MAQSPTSSSLLQHSLFNSIKTYLMNIDVTTYTEYEEQAKNSEMWFLGESTGSQSSNSSKKELRKLDNDLGDLEFGNLPQYPTPSITDNDSDSDQECSNVSDVHVMSITPRNRQASGFTDESDDMCTESHLIALEHLEDGIQENADFNIKEGCTEESTESIYDTEREREQPLCSSNSLTNSNNDIVKKHTVLNCLKYKVLHKDSINTIALKFNTSPNMLKQLNAFTSEVIFPGQIMMVPLQRDDSDTTLHPIQHSTSVSPAKNGRQFYKYSMKRITRFDGSVVGTTLLTSNAFMFRADVTNRLAVEHGHVDYNVSIPLDSICEVLMFESFEQMLTNIQNSGIIAEDDCPKCKLIKLQLRRTCDLDTKSNESKTMHDTPVIDTINTERNDFPDVRVIDPSHIDGVEEQKSSPTNLDDNVMEHDQPTSLEIIKNDDLEDFNPDVVSHDNCKNINPPGVFGKLGICSRTTTCQHEFEGYHSHAIKYSAKRRVNPFNFNKRSRKIAELDEEINIASGNSLLGSPEKEEINIDSSIHRVDSDTSLATKAFFKKIDDDTTKLQSILDKVNSQDFPIFISMHALLCSRTHGKPSYQCEEEEGHKTSHFWFSLSESDTVHLIDRLYLLCSQLNAVDDGCNCLLKCPSDYHLQLEDIILPDVKPKFVPREVDADLMHQPFSGDMVYNSDISVMMTEGMMAQVQPYLPCNIIGIDMVLLYSLRNHGMSLRSLYSKCLPFMDYPCLILIKDSQGYMFGAYMSHGIIESPKFYGSGETFLFRLTPDPQYFFWQGDNHYFMMGTSTYFTIGAGDGKFALYIDEMLQHGTSSRSQTFYNEVLSSSSAFDIIDVEVWCFSDEAAMESSEIETSAARTSSIASQYNSGRFRF